MDFTTLRHRLTGSLLLPGDESYDSARTGFQQWAFHEPAATVMAATAADIAAAVRFAADNDMRIVVQASGHGLTHTTTGTLMINTARLSQVTVDPQARRAHVAAGASWDAVIAAAAPHGLAPLSGSAPGVGAVSYTLGGGIGLLSRRYGFAADHVAAFELVTADGRQRQVTVDDSELFWALRGGGGNFGVVAAMDIDLMPVERIYGGSLYFPASAEILAGWRDWTRTVPEEMTSAVAMLPFPDFEGVPEELRGRHIAQLQVAYDGSPNEGEKLLAGLRALGTPVRDTVRTLSYSESAAVFDEPHQPHPYRGRAVSLRELPAAPFEELIAATGPDAKLMTVVGIRHLGGAMARPAEVPNAVPHHAAQYTLGALSVAEPGAESAAAAIQQHALGLWRNETIAPLLNFTFSALSHDEVAAAYPPEDLARLRAVRQRFDPNRLLAANHEIPG